MTKAARLQISKGLKARWLYSIDGVTWAAGKFTKGPAILELDIGRSAYLHHRVEMVEIKYKKKKAAA